VNDQWHSLNNSWTIVQCQASVMMDRRPMQPTTEQFVHGVTLVELWSLGLIFQDIDAVKSPLVKRASPKCAPRSIPLAVDPPLNPRPFPHLWTRPTYDAKRHPDPIRSFSTMHWTDRQTDRPSDRQTDRPTDRSRECLTTTGRCAPRATRPNNGSGLIVDWT